MFGKNLPPDYAHGWAGTLRRFAKKGLWVLFCVLVALALALWWTGNQAWKGLVFAWTSISGANIPRPSRRVTSLNSGQASQPKFELRGRRRSSSSSRGGGRSRRRGGRNSIVFAVRL